jgi:hypothetical protein
MYDFVFIHREAAPLGPPIFEWMLAKICRRKIIYDFDDAIWLTDRVHESWPLRTAKWRNKVAYICKWSYKVSCGNEYLCNFARRFSKSVVYNPTTIDTENLHNPTLHKVSNRSDDKVRIGWTGSHSTLKYLNEIEFVLTKILHDYPQVEFVLVGAVVKLLGLDAFNLLFGQSPGDITGPSEGGLLGAAIGIAAWLAIWRLPRLSLRWSVAISAVAGGVTGAAIALLGRPMMGGSLALLARSFPNSKLRIDSVGGLFGESDFGPITHVATSALEGALFSACLIGGMVLAAKRLTPRA